MSFRDPLNDPLFPNRPQSPDFWKISEILLWMDGNSSEGSEEDRAAFYQRCLSDVADPDAVMYAALERSKILFGDAPLPVLSVMAALWAEGVIVGAKLEEGKRKQ